MLLVFTILLCGVCYDQSGATRSPWEDTLEALQALLPKAAFIECVLQRSQDGATVAYGYDMRSRSWYEATPRAGRARTSQGRIVVARGSHQDGAGLPTRDNNPMIERRVLPFIWVLDVTSNSDAISVLTRNNDGFVLEFSAPRGDPRQTAGNVEPVWQYRLHINNDGHLTRSERIDAKSAEEIKILKIVQGYPICTVERGDWVVVEARVRESRGSIDWVSLCQEQFDRVRRLTGEERARRAADATVTVPPPGSMPASDGARSDGYSWLYRPMRYAGGFLVLVAFIFWLRKKKQLG